MRPDAPDPSALPPLRVEWEGEARTFDGPFSVGREACDLTLDNARVSRRHLQVAPVDGTWQLADVGSANGTFVDGERIERAAIDGALSVQVGDGGPVLRLSVGNGAASGVAAVPAAAVAAETPGVADDDDPFRPSDAPSVGMPPSLSTVPTSDRPPGSADLSGPGLPPLGGGDSASRPSPSVPTPAVPPEPPAAGPAPDRPAAPSAGAPATADGAVSYDAVVDRYFGEGEEGEEVGERTQFIRQAYREIQQTQAETQKKERSRYRTWIIGAVAVSIAALSYAGFLQYRAIQYRAQAQELFYQLKTYEVNVAQQVTQIQNEIEANPERADSLNVDLDRALAARRQTAARYDRFVRDLGVYDGLSSQEELIYKTARAFGESELTIPPAFVDEVTVQINYWKNGGRFVRGVRHAQVNGHDVDAVNALRRNGMPLEFFYLALQESDFNTRAVGPPTRYGHAKGAWQFIPETGRRYGLETGPLVSTNQYDPLDERHDFTAAADAAGRYLHDIYVHISQASGLLVCASYNWGEGRIKQHMRGIANDPEHRTYWKFLTTYRSRMPQETRDYVMKIFAAAVVGQNPRLFGIDMDPPVQVALAGGRGGIRTEPGPTSGQTVRMGGDALDQRRADDDD